ncbi:MAG: DNA primase [Saprospiraceae bacterium]|nr:DNA primase [Saprospiraceae bacterium]
MISPKSIDEVLEIARIEDVVRDYVDLKNRGSNLIGLCPFHKEKTPSFSVSPSKNIFKCFGCGKGGNTAQFVMEVEQLSFPEAIRTLAKKYQITLEESFKQEINPELQQEQESLYIINQFALNFYKDNLRNNPIGQSVALSYFKQRGFLEQIIEKFELGFAFDEPDALLNKARKEGFKLDFLQKLGLVTAQQKDFFRNRVIFPIHNLTGKPIAFAGRHLTSDSKSPKYINSPETELYQKSKTLYGLHLAKKSIRDKNNCFLVEGYTDVMALHQAGIENVVASSGTSLTEDQVHVLKRFTQQVSLLYDGDSAGIKAAMRGIDLLIQGGLDVKIILIPGNEDPDEFIRKIGADAFEKFVENESKDFIVYKLNLHSNEIKNDPIKKSLAAKDIIQTIAKVEDPIKRSIYLQQSAGILGIDEVSLISACNKIIGDELKNKVFRQKREALDNDQKLLNELSSESNIKTQYNSQITISNDEFQEIDICRILILYGHHKVNVNEEMHYAEFIIENIADTLAFFENELLKQFILDVSQQISQGKIPELNYYLNHTDSNISKLALNFSINKYEYSSNWEEKHGIFLSTQQAPELNYKSDIENSILRFKLKKFNKAISEFERRIQLNEIPEEELQLELKSHQHIVNQRNYIAGLLNTVVIN